MSNILLEGGNIFKDKNGQPLTRRIEKSEIMGTVKWLEPIVDIDFTSDIDPVDNLPVSWVGSTGRSPTSGDIDLLVNANEVNYENLITRLKIWCQRNNASTQVYIKETNAHVHFLGAIDGDPDNGYVQIDFIFTKKPNWSLFMMKYDPQSQYKGADRIAMMNSIAKSMGMVVNVNSGLYVKNTTNLVSNDPKVVAKTLLNSNATVRDVASVENMLRSLKMDPKKDDKLQDFQEYVKKKNIQFTDIIEESEAKFMGRLRDMLK